MPWRLGRAGSEVLAGVPREHDAGTPTILLKSISGKQMPVNPAKIIMIPEKYASGWNTNSPTMIIAPIVNLVKLIAFIT
jgi:hypothetical protein